MNLSDDIRQFMSLREPQSEALRRLEQISEQTDYRACTLATLAATAKEIVDGKPELEFDMDFASFCFAIATGVGKTRLMGASIYLLWQLKKYRNFFILAPNTTICKRRLKSAAGGARKVRHLPGAKGTGFCGSGQAPLMFAAR